MALNLTAFEDALRAWVVACTGLAEANVIFAHEDGPEPASGCYATITPLESADTLGMYPEQRVNDDGEVYTREHWRVEATVDTWRAGARQAMLTFKSRAYLPTYYAILQAADMSAHLGGETFLPGQKNRGWEEHAQVPIVLHHYDGTTTDEGAEDSPLTAGYFDQVEYSGEDMDPHPIDSTIITAPDA